MQSSRKRTLIRNRYTNAVSATKKKVNEEIENIKQCLSADSLDFSEYNDVTIRRLVEYIRVMKDNSIIIVLKGGMKIQESI